MQTTQYLKWLPLITLCSLPATCLGAEPTEDKKTTEDSSLLDQRVEDELATSERPFVITPHKVNYILPVTYNSSPNRDPFDEKLSKNNSEIDNLEAKFQISFKFPLMYNVFGDNGHLFFAYTNQSYWQVYNKIGRAHV